MAIYKWNFKTKDDHTLVVEHPFVGNVVVKLDDRVIKDTEQHEMSHEFSVDGTPCRLEITYKETDMGTIKMKSWLHHFFVDDREIPLLRE